MDVEQYNVCILRKENTMTVLDSIVLIYWRTMLFFI